MALYYMHHTIWFELRGKYQSWYLIDYKSGNGLVLSDNKTKSEPQFSRFMAPFGVATL